MTLAPLDIAPYDVRLYHLASRLMADMHGFPDLVRLVAEIAVIADKQVQSHGERRIACRAGCSHCCVLNVSALLPEAAAIADWLVNRLTTQERDSLATRLDHQRRVVRWMDDEERIHRGIPCIFLDSRGHCSIYPVRPLVCRAVTSLDSSRCLQALDPTETGEERAVPMDLLQKLVMEEAFRALARSTEERGMDKRSIELSAGVWAFLTLPALADDLLANRRLAEDLWE